MSKHDLNSGVAVALESVERLAQLIITAGKAANGLCDKSTKVPLDAEKFNAQVEIIAPIELLLLQQSVGSILLKQHDMQRF